MIREAVILAGGLGTRIREVLGETPKSLAEIDGKPFLVYLLEKLKHFQIRRVVLAVSENGYEIKKRLGSSFEGIDLIYSFEKSQLGTGGAIKKASSFIEGTHFLVINGDTYFDADLKKLELFHLESRALCTIALKKVSSSARFGTVRVNGKFRVVGFEEKKTDLKGFINAGIYAIEKESFQKATSHYPEQFSFEKDFLERLAGSCIIYGCPLEGYFIDIGIPEDLELAKKEMPIINSFSKAARKIEELKPERSWTLFLDRDGTINRRLEGDYVKNPDEFVFLTGIFDFLKKMRKIFGLIVIVTNQRGIGRGIMTEEDLERVHEKMLAEFKERGISIDGIYHCPHDYEKEECSCRKPKPGLALKAKADFPQIDFSKAVMVGDSELDKEFALNLGMHFIKV
jgi:D-glycero-alpha-D-manno-heptose 1-phosphate guanylyltransferase